MKSNLKTYTAELLAFIGPMVRAVVRFLLGLNLTVQQALLGREVRAALMNRRPLIRCTWAAVHEVISREAIRSLQASGSEKISEYVNAFDTEIKAKTEQLKDAETEIGRLQAEIRRYESQAATSKNVFSKTAVERDLYAGEVSDIVRDCLTESLNRVHKDSRREHVLKSILGGIPNTGAASANRDKLKEVLRGYRSMDAKTRKELEAMGFFLEEDGKHYKLLFQGDDRYTFVLPKSGSDHRGGLNAASDIANKLF